MINCLDLSLDDIIARQRHFASFYGGLRGAAPFPTFGRKSRRVRTGEARLFVSQLDLKVTPGELSDLFSQVGRLANVEVHHDARGKSLGTADVDFETEAGAARGYREFHHSLLRGRRMNVERAGERPARLPPALRLGRRSREGPPRTSAFARLYGGRRPVGRDARPLPTPTAPDTVWSVPPGSLQAGQDFASEFEALTL